jgi:hypothetical protein
VKERECHTYISEHWWSPLAVSQFCRRKAKASVISFLEHFRLSNEQSPADRRIAFLIYIDPENLARKRLTLTAFPESFDDVFSVFFSDSFTNLTNQNITPVLTAVTACRQSAGAEQFLQLFSILRSRRFALRPGRNDRSPVSELLRKQLLLGAECPFRGLSLSVPGSKLGNTPQLA